MERPTLSPFGKQVPGQYQLRNWPDRPRLNIVMRIIEVNGKAANVLGIARSDGSPGLRLDAGAPFDVELSSQIDAPTLIHWHGLTPPWDQDGVPDNPAGAIKPDQSRHYNFRLREGGTPGCTLTRCRSRASLPRR